jgi:hypothetical protein
MTFRNLGLAALMTISLSGVAQAAPAKGGVGLPLDPMLLPPNTGPGDCVVRRVTGPGGAYRWDRVECDSERGWQAFDHWGYERPPQVVERSDPAEWSQRERFEAWPHGSVAERGYSSEPEFSRPDDRYGFDPGYRHEPYRVDYRAAGRDSEGYLVWPGKRP